MIKITHNKKKCSRCNKLLPATLDYFYKTIKHSLGLSSICKNCFKIINYDKWEKLKRIVIGYYSNDTFKCSGCGCDIYDVLTIDHINNNAYWRKTNEISGRDFYIKIIKNRFPDDYQVLCWNCQHLKRIKKSATPTGKKVVARKTI